MSKNQRDLLKPLQASPTDVWASEFPLYAQTLKNGRCLLHRLPAPCSDLPCFGASDHLPVFHDFPVVGVAGFEPATLRLSSACSNQLSYTPGVTG